MVFIPESGADSGIRDAVLDTLSESAADFLRAVWPRIESSSLIGGGTLQPVEAVTDKVFADQIDLLAGVDAWHIQKQPSAVRGLASRVQWGEPRKTFTIRTRSKGGGETELEKRTRAIAHRDEGHLYPHWTVQAYLDGKGGNLLCAAVIKTIDLIERANFLKQHMKRNSNWFGYRNNGDGSQFMYIAWDDLLKQGYPLDVVGPAATTPLAE